MFAGVNMLADAVKITPAYIAPAKTRNGVSVARSGCRAKGMDTGAD